MIKQNLVPESKYSLKCPYPMEAVGICVHNTANDASAKNEIAYMVGNASQTSFHFAVDDIEVWQGLPLNRNGWHAGDGANGVGNRKHIAVEICYSKSGGDRFDKAENNAAELIAQLLKERGWSISQVKKHQDFSGKYCPHRTLDLGWERFINKIKEKLTMNMYLGIDLDNIESVKVAVQTWKEVIDGKYIKADQAVSKDHYEKLDGEKKNIETERNQLKEVLKAFVGDFTSPEEAKNKLQEKLNSMTPIAEPTTNYQEAKKLVVQTEENWRKSV